MWFPALMISYMLEGALNADGQKMLLDQLLSGNATASIKFPTQTNRHSEAVPGRTFDFIGKEKGVVKSRHWGRPPS